MFAASKSGSVDAKDAQFKNVTMLLHGNGTNGAQNNTFIDSSTNNFSITRNGNTTQGTFTPYGSNWSNYFDGTSAYLSVATNAGFGMGTGDCTLECWYYPLNSTVGIQTLIDIRTTNTGVPVVIGVLSSGAPYAYNGTTYSGSTVTNNSWNHIAFVRNGSGTNNCKLYLNGTQVTQFTDTADWGSTDTCAIGRNTGAAAEYALGYISNARVVKGTAVYTSAFTPSTTPLTAVSGTSLLTCQSNRFVDNSASPLTITVNGSPSVQRFSPFSPTTAYSTSVIGGSAYLDGTGDYFTLASNTATAFQSNNFTMEFYVYLTNGSANALQCFYSNYTSFTNAGSIYFGKHTNNSGAVTVWFSNYSTSGPLLAESTLPPNNQWTHYALVRSGNTFSLYRNGALSTSSTAFTGAATASSSASWIFTAGDNTALTPTGYLTDFRAVNGTAVYTASFTPPTAPLTAITNTSLLLNMTNAGILDNAMMNDLETVGNAQISTSVKKYGTGSMYFDGSGDRLYEPSNQNFNFGTGDFTIELWVYPISQGGHGNSNNDCLIDFRPAANGVYGTLYIFSSGTGIYWYVNSANRITGGAISNGVWTHIAICRSSGSTKLFLNGTQSGSTYTDANNYLVAPIMIGEFNDGAGAGNFNGYIDDLRITKGVARYTANFTAPTTAFADKG